MTKEFLKYLKRYMKVAKKKNIIIIGMISALTIIISMSFK